MEAFGFASKPSNPAALAAPKKPWEETQALWDAYVPFKPKPPQQAKQAPSSPPTGPTTAPVGFDALFARLIQQESRGKHVDAKGNLTKSPVGALGITQVMPKSGQKPGYGVAPLKDDSEEEYLRFGKDLLKAYTNEFSGDTAKGLAAYNAGIGRVQKIVAKHGDKWKEHLPAETKHYIETLLNPKPKPPKKRV